MSVTILILKLHWYNMIPPHDILNNYINHCDNVLVVYLLSSIVGASSVHSSFSSQ